MSQGQVKSGLLGALVIVSKFEDNPSRYCQCDEREHERQQRVTTVCYFI